MSEPYGHFFGLIPNRAIVEALARDEKLPPRLIRQRLKLAMQQACGHLDCAPQSGHLMLELKHLPDSAIRSKGRIGFMP